MSPSFSTPTIDELRARGVWSAALDTFAASDPEWTERCARMTNNPWSTGVLPVKWIELICIALNVACTHRNATGARRHIRAALDASAKPEEIRETFKGASVLGIHSVAVSLPILFEEADRAGLRRTPSRAGTLPTPVVDEMKSAGLFNQAWEVIYQLDPQWLEEFLAMGSDLYRGVLPAKLVELMAIAVDASCTHLYTPGIRRHIAGALERDAQLDDLMAVCPCSRRVAGGCSITTSGVGALVLGGHPDGHP